MRENLLKHKILCLIWYRMKTRICIRFLEIYCIIKSKFKKRKGNGSKKTVF